MGERSTEFVHVKRSKSTPTESFYAFILFHIFLSLRVLYNRFYIIYNYINFILNSII